jgi:hypothetical protein
MASATMKRIRVRGWWLLTGLAALVMAVPWPDWFVAYVYSRGVYPHVQRAVTTLSNATPWAVMDAMLLGSAGYLLWRLVRFVARIRERGMTSALWELGRRLVRTTACLVLVFVALWGLNYRRTPLEQSLRSPNNETARVVTTDDVRMLAEAAIRDSAQTRPSERGNGVDDFQSIADRLAAPFQRALEQLKVPPIAVTGRPKVSHILTPFFTAAGITGMVNPFALESIVHPDLLPFERPMVLAHEWAHLAGFADEADASAVAWLACVLGGADLAYSAHLFVVLESAAALPPSVWQSLRTSLSPGMVSDIQALAGRLALQQPAVRERAFAVYDGYLRTNRVPDGVRSYARVLRVLVAMRDNTQNPRPIDDGPPLAE